MKKTDISVLSKEDTIDLIGRQWMLITAGSQCGFNTMTASWGGIGYLWNRPVAFVFVRPERYTHEFIEQSNHMTLSFYDESYRKALQTCGTKSGRDTDKVKAAGLTPLELMPEAITFAESRLTLVGRKLFKCAMKETDFLGQEVLHRWYNDQPGGSLHDIYVVEIESVFCKE